MSDIKRLIKDTFVIKRKADEFTTLFKQNLEKIQQHFDKENLKELLVESETHNDIALVAKKTERVTIDYFVDKLKENLKPEIYNEIVRKTYYVDDMAGLVAMLKGYGVSPSEFKKFIRVEEAVDKAAIRRLYDTGDIKKQDIKGCYTAKVVKSIKIMPLKDG